MSVVCVDCVCFGDCSKCGVLERVVDVEGEDKGEGEGEGESEREESWNVDDGDIVVGDVDEAGGCADKGC